MKRNRRNARRLPGKGCRVDFSSRGRFLFSKEISFNHRLVDISEGGMRFLHPKKLKEGSSLTLTVHQPHTFLPLSLRGKVAWCERKGKENGKASYAAGIKFLNVTPRVEHQLKQLLDTLSGYFEVPSGPSRMAGVEVP